MGDEPVSGLRFVPVEALGGEESWELFGLDASRAEERVPAIFDVLYEERDRLNINVVLEDVGL